MSGSQGFAISILYPMRKTFVHKGLDFERFCRHVSFDASRLQDVEGRVEDEEMERLMHEAAKYTNDDYFGLHQGQLTEMADLGILGYVMMHSERVVDALAEYRRYNVIFCSGYDLDWEERGNDVRFRFFRSSGKRLSRHCLEDMVSSLHRLLSGVTQRPLPVLELHFTHEAPADLGPYVSIFGIEPRFGGDECYMLLGREALHYPIMYSDPRLKRAFEPIAGEIKARLLRGRELSDRVFEWMMACMPASFPTLQQTAAAFRMSARTLQAKLKEENTSFNDLASSVRKEWAITYLKKPEYAASEIAYLLHYSEPSAFHQAFKKWTGLTPGQYRRKIASELASG